jgi:hypothetical protein
MTMHLGIDISAFKPPSQSSTPPAPWWRSTTCRCFRMAQKRQRAVNVRLLTSIIFESHADQAVVEFRHRVGPRISSPAIAESRR